MEPEIKREIIMENYLHPYHKEQINTDYLKVNSNNESCIDNIDLGILIEDDIIKDIKFDGEACAISTASSSIMIQELIGKSVKEALDYITNFENMVNEEQYDAASLGNGVVFDDIFKQKSRKTCATLPHRGIKKALENYLENKKITK